VCGGIAGETLAVPLLVGLGVDELSVSVSAVPAVKARVRATSRAEVEPLARRALDASTAAEVRTLLADLAS
jgi:phosphocarrier protein FPr